jgi:hypothetical protein
MPNTCPSVWRVWHHYAIEPAAAATTAPHEQQGGSCGDELRAVFPQPVVNRYLRVHRTEQPFNSRRRIPSSINKSTTRSADTGVGCFTDTPLRGGQRHVRRLSGLFRTCTHVSAARRFPGHPSAADTAVVSPWHHRHFTVAPLTRGWRCYGEMAEGLRRKEGGGGWLGPCGWRATVLK